MCYSHSARNVNDVDAIMEHELIISTDENVSWTSKPVDFHKHRITRQKKNAYIGSVRGSVQFDDLCLADDVANVAAIDHRLAITTHKSTTQFQEFSAEDYEAIRNFVNTMKVPEMLAFVEDKMCTPVNQPLLHELVSNPALKRSLDRYCTYLVTDREEMSAANMYH